MKSRTFEFRTQNVRGVPSALLLVVGAIGVAALLALLLFVGAAVAVGALALSAGFALWHGVRRMLQPGQFKNPFRPLFERDAPSPAAAEVSPGALSTEVREIEVEVLPSRRD